MNHVVKRSLFERMEVSWLSYAPGDYAAQLEQKVASVRSRFAGLVGEDLPIDVYHSPTEHYRQRCRFAVRWFDGRLSYALFDRGGPNVAVHDFSLASRPINELMPLLMEEIRRSAPLHAGLAAVHFLSTQAGDMLVSLIYAEPLPPCWREAAAELRASLRLPALMGRAKGVVEVLDRAWVTEVYSLPDGRQLRYRQMEGSFSNPSAAMCEHTLGWLCQQASLISAECAAAQNEELPQLLELYCGNGNHTVALSQYFARVLAVEIDRKLCEVISAVENMQLRPLHESLAPMRQAAVHNLQQNGASNASILCAPSGKFCKRLLHKLTRPDQSEGVASLHHRKRMLSRAREKAEARARQRMEAEDECDDEPSWSVATDWLWDEREVQGLEKDATSALSICQSTAGCESKPDSGADDCPVLAFESALDAMSAPAAVGEYGADDQGHETSRVAVESTLIADSSPGLAAAAHPASETPGEISIMEEKKSAVELSMLSDDAAQWLAEARSRPDAVLVDPPRSGLDNDTLQLVTCYNHILYVSCNPEALHADLTHLSSTHFVRSFAVFDHFAYTNHLECGAYLTKHRS